jgi:MFS family permease
MSASPHTADRSRNKPALVSAYAAAGSVVYASGSVMGGWLTVTYSAPILGLLIVCALVAVVSGHIGRRRAKRHGAEGRWLSLAAIIVGWLCILYAVLVNLLVLGLIAGLAALLG